MPCQGEGRAVTIWLQNKERLWNHEKLVLAVALSAALVTNGQAASAGPLRVNGAPVDASGSYVHQNTTYVPLRTITEALRPMQRWIG